MHIHVSIVFILVYLVLIVCGQDDEGEEVDVCYQKDKCGECISQHPSCFWCSDVAFNGQRCGKKAALLSTKCANIYPSKPMNDKVQLEDKPLTSNDEVDIGYNDVDNIVQLQPQRVQLRLRPGTKESIKLKFRQAKGYPVDLYYVMDLSFTMDKHKKKLASLGEQLAVEMRKITKNFRLGFGSFVDKQVMPFISINKRELEEPCRGCIPTYGFRNHMSLDTNATRFRIEIKESRISGNLDGPEGGLDALMQAIVCTEQIGWRKQSRKLLIYASDATFHYAGDGKLAGIILPNDGKCHLDEKGYYTESNNQDYPSINQLAMKVQEHQVNLIFAVTEAHQRKYQILSNVIDGSRTLLLKEDSGNIVEEIKENYKSITRAFALRDNATGDPYVKISYKSACLGEQVVETNQCNNLRAEDTLEFTVDVEAISCPEDRKARNRTIRINPLNLNDRLLIDLEILCDCDCEKPWNEEPNSPKCSNGQGTYACGACDCNPGFYGKQCECSLNSGKIATADACKKNKNDSKACSGNGECSCGVCLCKEYRPNEKYYGPHCECDKISCKRLNGEVCGGLQRGTCDCGTCRCNPQWKGDACECPTGTEQCVDAYSGLICSNRGKCECGKCVCEKSSDMDIYTGTWCEDCPNCHGHCKVHEARALEQRQNHTEIINEDEYFGKLVDEIKLDKEDKKCESFDGDKCTIVYKYRYNDFIDENKVRKRRVIVNIQRERKCPEPINVEARVGGIIGTILLIGLLTLLLWKILTTWHDKREYEKFEKEIKSAQWDSSGNPLFKPSTANFENPTFGRTSMYQ